MTWQWAGRRPGAGLPRLLPRAGRLLQRWCGPAETWRRCACRLCCGFPGATYLRAKIQHFITSAKCLGVFRSATPKRPAPAAPSAARGASAPRRRPHCPPAEPAAAVCKVFSMRGKRPNCLEANALRNRAFCRAKQPVTACNTGRLAYVNGPPHGAGKPPWGRGELPVRFFRRRNRGGKRAATTLCGKIFCRYARFPYLCIGGWHALKARPPTFRTTKTKRHGQQGTDDEGHRAL